MIKKVSILIPVYNRASLIEETVNSALSQTYGDVEIVIVDNRSTDNTWKVLQKLSKEDNRIKIFQNEKNIGPVRNWMRCIDEAKGEYAKILWSDDLIACDFLEKTVPYLENHDVGFVFTGTEIFNDITSNRTLHYFIGESGIYDSENYIRGALLGENYPVSPGCAIFRLKDLKSNLLVNVPNRVNCDFSMHAIGNDILIYLLTAHHYTKFAFVNEKLSFFRDHEGSITIQSKKGRSQLLYNLAKAYFVENYRRQLIRKLNANIWIDIKRFRKTAKMLNLDRVGNFYLYNTDYSMDKVYLTIKFFRYAVNKLKSLIGSFK